MLLGRRLVREGLRRHRVRASRAGRDEWGRDRWAGRGPASSCALACQAVELVAAPAREPDGSAVAASAPPCQGAEAPRDARPAVRRDSGAAAGARAFQELATPGARTPGTQTPGAQMLRSETTELAAQCEPPAGKEASPTRAASAQREWAPVRAAAVPTRFGRAEA